MAVKRMFSLDDKANSILNFKKKQNSSLSGYVSKVILNDCIPVFSIELRTFAIYLLDLLSDDGENGKLLIPDFSVLLRKAISTTMLWLAKHRISNFKPIKEFLAVVTDDSPYDFENWSQIWDKNETYIAVKDAALAATSKRPYNADILFQIVEAMARIEIAYISELFTRDMKFDN